MFSDLVFGTAAGAQLVSIWFHVGAFQILSTLLRLPFGPISIILVLFGCRLAPFASTGGFKLYFRVTFPVVFRGFVVVWLYVCFK